MCYNEAKSESCKVELREVVQMHIETQRILIRSYTMDDVRDLHDILGNAEVMKKEVLSPRFTRTAVR